MSLLPKDGIWSDLQIRDFHLEEYAHSLGLPNIPGDLEKVLENVSSRDGLRVVKNVNRKLQKLKEQIRLEKEEKKKKRKRESQNERSEAKMMKTIGKEEDDEEEDGLLVVKARHEPIDTGEEEDVPLSFAKPRKPKKIRIDGGNSNLNNHTVFEEDGTVQPTMLHAEQDSSDDSEDGSVDNEEVAEALRGANDGYLEQVRQRLEKTKELDKQEERERIRAKHKKKRMKEKKEKSDGEDDESIQVATLDTTEASDVGNGDANSESSSSEASSIDDDGSGSDDDENDDMDVAKQEDIALSLIRGIS
jgi:ATP-dependent RNA helicase DDX10/DBP4